MGKIKFLEIILKITERCNINCDYCYYFNGVNNDYKYKPVYMNEETVINVADGIVRAIDFYSIEKVQIDIHGGEPLLYGKEKFEFLIDVINMKMGNKVELIFVLQTNGLLIDDEWIRIFSKNKVHVSVSLDGDRDANDKHRVDLRGKGTYEDAVKGLSKLCAAANRGDIPDPGIICVVNPVGDGKAVYKHFSEDIGIKKINFILPDMTHDELNVETVKGCGKFINDAMTESVLGNGVASINILDMAIAFMRSVKYFGECEKYSLITLRSDGEIALPDDFRNLSIFKNDILIKVYDVIDFMENSNLKRYIEEWHSVPDECSNCAVKSICCSGSSFANYLGRYSSGNSFGNKNLYCDVFLNVIAMAYAILDSSGDGCSGLGSDLDSGGLNQFLGGRRSAFGFVVFI